METPLADPALAALDSASQALGELDAGCCEPGRSPRMRALDETLTRVRSMLGALEQHPELADDVFAGLEDAGAQIGSLQVGCCAPNRMPLYADMLVNLTEVQRSVTKALGRGH